MNLIPKIFLIALFTNLVISSGKAVGDDSNNATLLISMDSELQHFVKIVQSKYDSPITEYEINHTILTAALMFDALGAYGVRYTSSSESANYLSSLVDKDSLNLIPSLAVFTDGRGNAEDLAILYSAILETSGIVTALLKTPDRIFVMFNTGVHRRYSGAISRDITSYLIKNNQVWFAVDMTLLGKPFHKAWQNTCGKIAGTSYELLPIVSSTPDLKIKRAKIFSSSIKKTEIDKLFLRDKKYFENDQVKSKLNKVTAIMQDNYVQAKSHINNGLRHSESHAYEKAINEFEKAEELGGDSGLVFFLIANVYREKRDYQKMKVAGMKLVKFNKRDPRGYNILGFVYHVSGKSEIADRLFSRAKFLENHLLSANK